MSFTRADIPDLSGRLAVVTGATGGLGYETALALAGAGASVVLTGRNETRGRDALARIRAAVPRADVTYAQLDLTSLAAVAAFADHFANGHDRLDLLINNAGVMAIPTCTVTADGFETQFETNYLSHFALTARLLPLLRNAGAPRVVPLSSIGAHGGRIDFADLQSQHGYRPMTAYMQTKLACLMFAFELQRRSDAGGWGIASIAAHPGVSATNLIANSMRGPAAWAGELAGRIMFQSAAQGALPTLYAATAPDAKPGGYYGPHGLLEWRGHPATARPPGRSLDTAVAARLWDVSESLTGVRFPGTAKAA